MAALLQAVLACVLLLAFGAHGSSHPHKKVLIFYVHGGHQSAAQGIARNISKIDPHAEVILKDMTDLSKPWQRLQMNTNYPLMARHAPWLIHMLFGVRMSYAQKVRAVTARPIHAYVDLNVFREYVEEINPDAVISTFAPAAEALVYLRSIGYLRNIPLAWQHTDLVSESYFAELSSQLDMTFLPHPTLEKNWIERGIPEDRVLATGMVVPPHMTQVSSSEQIANARAAWNLAESRPTFLLLGGSMGTMPYDKIVDELQSHVEGPIQILVVCGSNRQKRKQLDLIQNRQAKLPSGSMLRKDVTLIVEGRLTSERMHDAYGVADLIISKPGGLSSFELMYQQTPVVFYNYLGGHEADNALFMAQEKLALVANQLSELGSLVNDLIHSPDAKAEMLQNQNVFRSLMHPELAAQWALSSPQPKQVVQLEGERARKGDSCRGVNPLFYTFCRWTSAPFIPKQPKLSCSEVMP